MTFMLTFCGEKGEELDYKRGSFFNGALTPKRCFNFNGFKNYFYCYPNKTDFVKKQ